MPTFAATRAGYHNLWAKCQVTRTSVGAVAQQIAARKATYQQIEASTGVPWFLIGALHYRESDLDFNTYLGNGQPLDRATTEVPRNRGPFADFKSGAIDALKYDHLDAVKFDGIERVLFQAEAFNGFGYYAHGVNSPYVWAATSLQQPGKFTSDGVFDPSAADSQLGVAAILKALCAIDSTVAAFCAGPTQEKPVTTPTVPALQLDYKTLETLIEQGLPLLGQFVPQVQPFVPIVIALARALLQAQPPAPAA